MDSSTDWNSYSKLVLTQLDRHDKNDEMLNNKIDNLERYISKEFEALKIEINTIKIAQEIKAKEDGRVWGIVSGIITGVVIFLIKFLLTGSF